MFIPLFVILAGLTTSLIAWLLVRRIASIDASPDEPDLPRTWRLIWPLVMALSPWCERFLSWSHRDRLVRCAQQAGLPAVVRPAHMMAYVVWWVTIGVALGLGVMLVFNMQNSVLIVSIFSGMLTGAWAISQLAVSVRKRRSAIERELPFVLDIMTLCVESGLSLHGALQQAEQHGPSGPLRDELRRALTDMRAGAPRAKALEALANRCDCSMVCAWVATLIQGDRLGMNVGVLLREHAAQCRVKRIQRAERLAMEAPVKMLLPLIGCIFPCTFIVLAFPIVLQIRQSFS